LKQLLSRFTGGEQYPRQIWILFWGSLISMTGQSLVWPFLTIYIRQQLDVSLTQVTFLFTLQSIASMVATAAAGPAVDRFGRKGAMILSPIISAAMLIAMTQANSLVMWGALLMVYASAGVVFRLGANAMVADMIPPEDRVGAYALMRMGFNVGIAIGPTIGGFLIAISYSFSFLIAAAVQFGLGLTIIGLIQETLPDQNEASGLNPQQNSGGFGPLLRDGAFMSFWSIYLLVEMAASLVFTLLSVYVKEQYQIPESQFGFIIGTNATMVVLFQYAVTRVTKRHRPLPVMAVSAVFYGAGMAIYALSQSFWGFWLGMVVMTTGELILSPTATALVADLAPPDMRGRYMGVYGLSYRVGGGIGPVMGGWLSDTFFPAATWYFGMVSCLLGAAGFTLMARGRPVQKRKAEHSVQQPVK
jgi:MFS family permease